MSGISVELEPWLVLPRTGSKATDTHADINFLYPSFDGSSDLYVADGRGVMYRITNNELVLPAFLDLREARQDAFFLNHVRSTGLRSFAFHPDCGRPARPGNCKLYTAHTETVESAPATTKLFEGGFDKPVIYHNVVDEWDVILTPSPQVILSSRRELFRVEQRANHHNLDQLMFDPNKKPGDLHYGLMWISLGDGISKPDKQDPDDQARNPARLLGKIAVIDPLAKFGLPYTIPSSNPHINTPGFLPEIWARGFRHPQNIAFDTGGSGQLFIIDIGEAKIEEVNLGVPGGDYGWPERQGTFVNNRRDNSVLGVLPANDAQFNYTYPVAQYDHSEGFAIVGGYVYRGSEIPELEGHYVFGDIVKGRIFHLPVDELSLGSQATIKELTLQFDGAEQTMLNAIGLGRADLRIGIDTRDELYASSKQTGQIWRLRKPSGPGGNPDLLVAPKGTIDIGTPQFEWNSFAGSVAYRLRISGGNGVIELTLSAEDLGCTGASATCRSAKIALATGAYSWSVFAINNNGAETSIGDLSFNIDAAIDNDDFSPVGAIDNPEPQFQWPSITRAIQYQLDVTKSTGDINSNRIGSAADFNCQEENQVCSFVGFSFPQGAYDWSVSYRETAGGPWIEIGNLTFTLSLPDTSAPMVDTGPDMFVHINTVFEVPGQVTGGNVPFTFGWSVVEAQNNQEWAVKLRSPDTLALEAKITRTGRYRLRLTVSSGNNSGFDELNIYVLNEDEPLPEPVEGPLDPLDRPAPQEPALEASPLPPASPGKPVVNAGADIVAIVNQPFQLSGAADAVGPMTALWSVVSSSSNTPWAVQIGDPGSLEQEVTVTRIGLYKLRLEVIEGTVTVSDEVNLKVVGSALNLTLSESSVEADAGPDQTIPVNVRVPLIGTATAGSTVKWDIVSSSLGRDWAVRMSDTMSLSQSVKFTRSGPYSLRLTATMDGNSASDTVTFEVLD